jgi:hypothetical protein
LVARGGHVPVVKAPNEQSVKAIPALGPIVAAALPPASRLIMIGAAANAEKVLNRLSFCAPRTSTSAQKAFP